MYQIGGILFEIRSNQVLHIPDHFSRFQVDDSHGRADYIYHLTVRSDFKEPSGKLVFNKDNIQVYQNGSLETRVLSFHKDPKAYAMYEEKDRRNIEITFHPDYLDWMDVDTVFNSLFALERRMYEHNMFIIHSAFMCYREHAILFSAPSGTGKSTQADLWEKYRGSYTVNGDRSLLKMTNKGFDSMGWPVCGSSEICLNETHSLATIVFLSQAPVNHIETLDFKSAVKKMMSEMTINYWNPDFVNKAYDFIMAFASNQKIFHLACTPDKQAVACLERKLKEEYAWML